MFATGFIAYVVFFYARIRNVMLVQNVSFGRSVLPDGKANENIKNQGKHLHEPIENPRRRSNNERDSGRTPSGEKNRLT